MIQQPSFKYIPLNQIRVGERLRPASLPHVQHLFERISQDGFSTAVTLWQEPGQEDYTLVDGLHRFEAAKLCGLSKIPAMVRAATTEGYDLLLEEATLNLARADLTPYDKASSVVGVYEALLLKAGVAKGQSARKLGAKARWAQSNKFPSVYHEGDVQGSENTQASVRVEAARICGLGLETFKKLVGLYRNLLPELVDALRPRPEFNILAVLLEISRTTAQFQASLTKQLIAKPDETLREIMAVLVEKPQKSSDISQDYLAKFVRLNAETQENVLPKLFAGIRPIARGETLAVMAKELNIEQKRGLLSVLADDLGVKIEGELV